MKTVLFIERDLVDEKEDLLPTFRIHEKLYEEIAEAFNISICYWYSQGQTIETAVPDLYKILDGVSQWRGVVVSDLSYGRGKHAHENVVANPFDLYDMPEIEEGGSFRLAQECLDDPLPLIRISRMLGGIPKAYRMRSYEQGTEKPYENAMMRYHLNCPFPKELAFITPRNTNVSVLMFDEVRARKDLFDALEYSFVERNGYADCSRFIVVDRTLPPSTLYNNEMLAFWLFVLSYGMESEGRSTLDIGQLYKANLELDEDEFIISEAKRFAQFGVALDSIEEHVRTYRKERKSPSNAERQKLPDFQERVTDYYQFARVQEEREGDSEERRAKENRFFVNQSIRVTREPKRFIRRAIEEFRQHKAPTTDEIAGVNLNASAQEELFDLVSDTELRLATLDESCSLETLRNQKKVEKPEKTVSEYPMMTRGRAIGMAILAVALMAISASPIPIGMLVSGTAGVVEKMILLACLLVFAIIAAVGIALGVQYYLMRKHGIEISQQVSEEEVVTPIEERISKASERMSDYLSVRNGWMYYEHDVPETALIGDHERFLAEKYADLNQTLEPLFTNQQLQRYVNEERRNLPIMDWPHILKDLHAGRYDGLQLHSRDAFALFNTDVEGLSRYRVPLKCIRRVDLVSISPTIVREVK